MHGPLVLVDLSLGWSPLDSAREPWARIELELTRGHLAVNRGHAWRVLCGVHFGS